MWSLYTGPIQDAIPFNENSQLHESEKSRNPAAFHLRKAKGVVGIGQANRGARSSFRSPHRRKAEPFPPDPAKTYEKQGISLRLFARISCATPAPKSLNASGLKRFGYSCGIPLTLFFWSRKLGSKIGFDHQ